MYEPLIFIVMKLSGPPSLYLRFEEESRLRTVSSKCRFYCFPIANPIAIPYAIPFWYNGFFIAEGIRCRAGSRSLIAIFSVEKEQLQKMTIILRVLRCLRINKND